MKYNAAAVYHPNGNFMFYCDQRRAQWYLNRNLAKVRETIPERLEIQLLFEPKGIGPNDEFSSHQILQQCVVCSSHENLTKHHIVPSCYRKFFPKEYKSRINHDVVIVCEKHHHVYEDFANVVKDYVAHKYNVPSLQECSEMQSASSNPLLKKLNIVKSLLRTYFEQLENGTISVKVVERLQIMGIDPATDDLKKLFEDNDVKINTILEMTENVEHGQLVVSKLEDIDKFIKMWRKHFVETMQPQYMPIGWSVEYKTKVVN